MSGTVVATPMIMPAIHAMAPILAGAAAGAAFVGSVVGLASNVKRLVDLQAAAALEHQRQERGRLREWVTFQQRQARRMAEIEKLESVYQDSERRLAALDLSLPAAVQLRAAEGGPEAPAARAYLSLGQDRVPPERLAKMLGDLREFVVSLPQEFRDAQDSPYARLVEHQERLASKFRAGAPLRLEELATLKETFARTLGDFRRELASRQAHAQAVHKRLETALNEVLFYEHLATSLQAVLPEEHAELQVLRQQVTALLTAEDVSAGALQLLEGKLASLKAAVDRQVVYTAHRRQLLESVVTHLTDMGYEPVVDFVRDDAAAVLHATMRIPGGERVRIALHQNGQMAFEVLHERAITSAERPSLTLEELALLHRQEGRWCRDFRELIRRLAAEGFTYTVDLEREIPNDSVKVVVVETADDILAQEEDQRYRDEPRKRYLS